MSQSIDTAMVAQYRDDILFLASQEESRLRAHVNVDTSVTGEKAFFERIGQASFQVNTTRHGDSPLIEIPHSRRMATFTTYETGDLIDNADRVRTLISPDGAYTKRQAEALNRAIDTEIIEAASRAAATGKAGAGSQAFDSNNIVAEVSTGLTLDKVLQAKRILDANEVPKSDRIFVTNALGLEYMLNVTQVTSSDYNSVKALVQGELDTFLGFKWITTELLEEDATVSRWNLAFHRDAITLGMPMDLSVHIDPARSDKRFGTYIMYEAVFGAVRMEEERIVKVLVDETA